MAMINIADKVIEQQRKKAAKKLLDFKKAAQESEELESRLNQSFDPELSDVLDPVMNPLPQSEEENVAYNMPSATGVDPNEEIDQELFTDWSGLLKALKEGDVGKAPMTHSVYDKKELPEEPEKAMMSIGKPGDTSDYRSYDPIDVQGTFSKRKGPEKEEKPIEPDFSNFPLPTLSREEWTRELVYQETGKYPPRLRREKLPLVAQVKMAAAKEKIANKKGDKQMALMQSNLKAKAMRHLLDVNRLNAKIKLDIERFKMLKESNNTQALIKFLKDRGTEITRMMKTVTVDSPKDYKVLLDRLREFKFAMDGVANKLGIKRVKKKK